MISFDKAEFLSNDVIDNNNFFDNTASINMDKNTTESYLNYFKNLDYAKPIFSNAKPMVFRDTDLLEDNLRIKTEFFNDYLKSMSIYYAASVSIAHNGLLLGVLSLFRERHKGDFSNKDLYILKTLYNHIDNRCYKDFKCNEEEERKNIILFANIKKKHHITNRELEIITLVLEGLNNNEISGKLFISNQTMKTHMKNIYRKMGVNNRIQLVNYILNI